MNNPLVFQAIGVLLILGFIFLLVMCWKSWRITHILFTFLAFSSAITFLVFASMTLKTQAAWRKHFNAYTAALEKAETERESLLHGDLLKVQQPDDCVRHVRARLDDELVDRGRVWRKCRLVGSDAETLRVTTVPADLAQGATSEPNGIVRETLLYAFTETAAAEGSEQRVPAYYLGEFVVRDATDTEVTLAAALPLDPDQVERIRQGGTTWTLYEAMPLDSHEVFAEMDEVEKRLVGLDPQELAPYFPNLYNWPEDRYAKFLERYHRFNREATEADPPEETWVLVKFVKPHKIQVDSDAEQSLLEGEGRYFDSSGRAIEARLRRGEDGTVEFQVGDSGIFDAQTADTLIADGLCEKVKTVYRRLLHDYQHFFRTAYLRYQELDQAIARATADRDEMAVLKTKAEEQVAYRTAERVKLESDYAGFQRELAEATNTAAALQQAWADQRARLSQLFQTNRRLADELAMVQARLTQEINRAVQPAATAGAATASSP